MSIPDQSPSFTALNEIKEYMYVFWSWAWLIVLFGLIAGGVAYITSIQTTPIYQTSTRLLVSDPPAMQSLNYSGIVNAQSLAGTYSKMMVDRPVLQGVIERLNLSMTSDELKPLITVDIISGTQLLSINVQNANPILAADIANTIAAVFTERIRDLQAQRYSSTRDGLALRVSEMEKKVSDTTSAITAERHALGLDIVITNPNATPNPALVESPQLLQLESRLTEYQRLYSELVTNYEQVRLAEAQTSTNVFVSEPASVPRVPISPNTNRSTMFAAVVGVMLAVGLIFAIEYLDDTIKNPEDLKRRFNLPIVGFITHHTMVNGRPISLSEPRSPVVEAFRTLRTNITFSGVDKPLRRIIVTSSVPQEGKTTVSSNLAVVLAQGDRKAVLIDADLRRPQIHQKFALSNRIGLANLFIRQTDVMTGILQPTELPQLSVITSGILPPNPSELLTSMKMAQVLDRLNEEFDVIIIDTPPVLTVTDAAAMAANIDGVILVVKPGVTKLSALAQTVEQMQAVGARILGVVLNDIKPSSRKYGFYYRQYYSKYSYYYGKDDKKNQKNV
jgi:non-specific protein-tyrosine kinase